MLLVFGSQQKLPDLDVSFPSPSVGPAAAKGPPVVGLVLLLPAPALLGWVAQEQKMSLWGADCARVEENLL